MLRMGLDRGLMMLRMGLDRGLMGLDRGLMMGKEHAGPGSPA